MHDIPVEGAFPKKISEESAKLALDIFETDDTFVIIVPLAGVRMEDVHIRVSEDILSLSGKRQFPKDFEGEEKNFFLKECYWGEFSRSIVLPAAVSSADIKAQMRDGVLFITMPKARKVHQKDVKIESVNI